MRRIIGLLGIAVAVLILGLAAYETWRVFEARAETSTLIAERLAVAKAQNIALPRDRIDILLAVEDPTFFENAGYDFETPGAGWTTLTQGLAKRLYFEKFEPGFEKIELILIARFALTSLASKDEILTAVLATVYLGRHDGKPVIGFAEGARVWFGRPLAELADEEFISLVAMLVAPDRLDPVLHPADLAERVARIKRLIAGSCTPTGWSDVELQGCANES